MKRGVAAGYLKTITVASLLSLAVFVYFIESVNQLFFARAHLEAILEWRHTPSVDPLLGGAMGRERLRKCWSISAAVVLLLGTDTE